MARNGRYRIPRAMAKLDPQTVQGILSYVRSGTYDFVAAEAHGVDREVWAEWMERGIRGEEGFIDLYAQVAQASAQARALSEIDIRSNNPLAWLRFGPPRHRTRGGAGWGEEKLNKYAGGDQSISLDIVDASLRLESGNDEDDE